MPKQLPTVVINRHFSVTTIFFTFHDLLQFFSLLEATLVTGLVGSKWSSLFSNVYLISFTYKQCTNLITLSVNIKELGQYLSLFRNCLLSELINPLTTNVPLI